MAVDQSMINLLQLIPTNMKKAAGTNGGEWHGPCPMCGGRDRFVVQPNAGNGGRWSCRQCSPTWGDAVAFLMTYNSMSFADVLKAMNLATEISQLPKLHKTLDRVVTKPTKRAADETKWQERAHAFIEWSDSTLWDVNDTTGLDYLYERGFSERTICRFTLGYNPFNLYDDWGLDKKVWLPAGIVIPYVDGREITKIRIRRRDWTEGDQVGKYIPPAGVKNTAFCTRSLIPRDVVVLVEGEFDAIAVKEAVPDPEVVAVATGGTTGARVIGLVARLALASAVLVAYDTDDAGETASRYWLDALPNAVRLPPLQHDVNDMLLAGDDFYQWIEGGLS